MKKEELNEILRLHKVWRNGEEGGKRADLQRADLHGESLESVDLAGADLQHSDLRNAILRETNLKFASLDHADLQGADLQGTNLSFAEMKDTVLKNVDLHNANLYHAEMRGANIDNASWPLWCWSLQAYVDDRIAIQLLYHTLSVVQNSPYVSEEVKKALLSSENVRIANRFHRVGECGKIEEWEDVSNDVQRE